MSSETYEVFHSISGIEIDTSEPSRIGDFTFYQFPRDRVDATKQYVPDLDSTTCDSLFLNFRDAPSVVGVKVKATDTRAAQDKARILFTHLANIFSFLLFDTREIHNISVFSAKPITRDPFVVLSDSHASRSFSLSGRRRIIELSKLLQIDDCFFKNLIEGLTDTSLPKAKKKILLSVDFCGLAVQSIGQPSSFVQAITALESLLSTSSEGIVRNVSDNYAFIFGRNFSERVELKKKVKELYDKRSKLAHGTISEVSNEECLKAIFYARNVINAFLVDEKLKTIKNNRDFDKYIEELKFGATEGANV